MAEVINDFGGKLYDFFLVILKSKNQLKIFCFGHLTAWISLAFYMYSFAYIYIFILQLLFMCFILVPQATIT